MRLEELLATRREALVSSWIESTFSLFPKETATFLRTSKDPFANPVGATVSTELASLFDVLLQDAPAPEAARHLDPIVQVRSVQDCPPSEAVSFVFLLKEVVRRELAAASDAPAARAELTAFEDRIDRLALLAFDSYTKFRARIHELRVQEVKNRVSGLLRRSRLTADDLG